MTEAVVESEQFVEQEVKSEISKAEEAVLTETVAETAKAAEGIEAEVETVAEQVEKVLLEEGEKEAEKAQGYIGDILGSGNSQPLNPAIQSCDTFVILYLILLKKR